MKKISIVFVVALLLLLTPSVLAEGEYSRLQDTAMLLSESEQGEILGFLDEVSERQGMDIVILTVDYVEEGFTVEEAATEWYEYLGYSEDGVMLYISMAERDWYLLTSGFGITAINDAGIEFISNDFLYYLSDGLYAEAFNTFIQDTDDFITQAKAGEPYDYGTLPYGPFPFGFFLVVCFVIALIISAIVTGIWRLQLGNVGMQSGAADYMKAGSLNLQHSQDIFLYRNVSRVVKETSSSGGSTIHKSSSGRSYGGRGGKF